MVQQNRFSVIFGWLGFKQDHRGEALVKTRAAVKMGSGASRS